MNSSDLLTYITSAKLGTGDWRGSVEGFITHWQNQIRLYERLCEPNERFSDGQKKTMLQNAVAAVENLSAVKQAAELERTKTGTDLTYDQYCSLLLSAAVTYDQTFARKKVDCRTAFFHDLDNLLLEDTVDDPYGDDTPVSVILANAAAQQRRPLTGRPDRVMMPKQRWMYLSQEARDTWDTLSEKDKAIIIGYSDDKIPAHQRPPDQRTPLQRVSLHDMTIAEFLQAHIHESIDVPDGTTDKAAAAGNADGAAGSPPKADDDSTILINALQSGKRLSPGDVRRVLSSSLAKKDSKPSGGTVSAKQD